MQTDPMTLFNSNVRRRLEATGLTVQELADKIGMQRQALSKILNGHVDTSLGNADRIATGIGVPLHELIQPAETRLKKTSRRRPQPQAA